MPDKDRLLSLLDAAFDDWGRIEHLRWKYDHYPGFDPADHAFYIERDGDLAAFRRVFGKELQVDGQTVAGYGLGDTTVAEAYRGQGLYSQLHSTTVQRCRDHGVDFVFTFNRTNNVTFAANRERGWQYGTLPLQMRILSPQHVLSEYADLVIDDWPRLQRVVDLVGDRVTLVVDGNPVPLSAFGTDTAGGPTRAKRSVRVPVPRSAVRRAVRAFGRQSKRGTVSSLLCSLSRDSRGSVSGPGDGDGSLTAGRVSETNAEINDTGTLAAGTGLKSRPQDGHPVKRTAIQRADDLEITEVDDPDDFERIRSLYETARTDASVSFRRNTTDIEHLCQYPTGRSVLLAERGVDLHGFAVLGTRRTGKTTEGRVLDIVSTDDVTFRRLVDEIERVAAERGHDVVLMLSHRDAGQGWVSIEKQVVMWDWLTDCWTTGRLDADWHVGLYDVV